MKVLVGSMTAESNMLCPYEEQLEEFEIFYGDQMIDRMYSKDLFDAAGIELIPSIFASGGARGYVAKSAYDFILKHFTDAARAHKDEIDGVFFFLHGASHVVGLYGDSAEHDIVEKVREILGPDIPMAVCMDPHGNLSKRLCDMAQIIRTFRESPHFDRQEAHRITARMLIDLLQRPRHIETEYARVPMLIGGERCVSADEPLATINRKLTETEQEEGIMSACFHVGYAWADSPLCCAAVSVVPTEERYQEKAGRTAKALADYIFAKREEFHFTGYAQDPNAALAEAFETEKRPVFMTDAGDNVTAGALGHNTFMLKQFLERKDYCGKKVLIASIFDAPLCNYLLRFREGDHVAFTVGVGIDGDSGPVSLTGVIKAIGDHNSFYAFPRKIGDAVTVTVDGFDLDLTVTNKNNAYREVQQFKASGLDYTDYDIIVVKQGYLYTEEEKLAGLSIMSLTPGMTYQYTEELPYKTIFRPMFPVDKIFY